jgi:hypothetical protein
MHYVVSVDVGVKPNQAKPNRFRDPPNWCQVLTLGPQRHAGNGHTVLMKIQDEDQMFSVVVPLQPYKKKIYGKSPNSYTTEQHVS